MKCENIDNCIEEVKKYINSSNTSSTPFIVNVNNINDYKNLYSKLDVIIPNTIRTSDFCKDGDNFPNIDKMFLDLNSGNQQKNSIIIGLTEVLKLLGETKLNQRLDELKSKIFQNVKIVLITFKCQTYLDKIINKDLRLDKNICSINSKLSDDFEEYIFSSCDKTNKNQGLQRFLISLEDKATITNVYTNISKKFFENAQISITFLDNSFDKLCYEFNYFKQNFQENLGTTENWDWYYKTLNRYDSIEKIRTEYFTTNKLETVFHKWNMYNSNECWLYWLLLHIDTNSNNYLTISAIKSKDTKSFEGNIFNLILDEELGSKDFNNFYEERKLLLKIFNESNSIVQLENNFLARLKAKETNRILYLTDITKRQKEEIIGELCRNTYNDPIEVKNILKRVYRSLYNYLSDYNFDNEMFNQYFKEYKFSKLTNNLTEDFLEKVMINAKERPFNSLPTRISEFEKMLNIKKDDTYVFFVDALGVEFLGYILQKNDELNFNIDISICRSNLPTTTYYNKDFTELIDTTDSSIYIKNEKLDELKHHGEGNFDYTKTKLPLHLINELEIIDELFNNIQTKLGEKSKVIVVSDHGASRLSVLHENFYKFDVDSKGTNSGRCCAYYEGIPNIEFATIENDHYILANYDRFKGGRAGNVEVHGGATLEEVLVPVIQFSIKNNDIKVWFDNKIIKFDRKKPTQIILHSTHKLSKAKLKINDNYYNPTKNDDLKYQFDLLDIKKAGKYNIEIYDGNNFIDTLAIDLEKSIAKEVDLF